MFRIQVKTVVVVHLFCSLYNFIELFLLVNLLGQVSREGLKHFLNMLKKKKIDTVLHAVTVIGKRENCVSRLQCMASPSEHHSNSTVRVLSVSFEIVDPSFCYIVYTK
ncbi:UNVERIFIED_CONTAM: hypothetical protein K2H54_039147 [Gekko kuhli]